MDKAKLIRTLIEQTKKSITTKANRLTKEDNSRIQLCDDILSYIDSLNDNVSNDSNVDLKSAIKIIEDDPNVLVFHDQLMMCKLSNGEYELSPYYEWWHDGKISEKFKDSDKIKLIIVKDEQ